ncbi:MAG: hypothetical protein N4A44_03925 [Alphaproteobacteria bacterium]|jgi:hypothetical protein|nr:hypothetical protein [Alphaproteobacteria bacterium]
MEAEGSYQRFNVLLVGDDDFNGQILEIFDVYDSNKESKVNVKGFVPGILDCSFASNNCPLFLDMDEAFNNDVISQSENLIVLIFTHSFDAVKVIEECSKRELPIVLGTSGWNKKLGYLYSTMKGVPFEVLNFNKDSICDHETRSMIIDACRRIEYSKAYC